MAINHKKKPDANKLFIPSFLDLLSYVPPTNFQFGPHKNGLLSRFKGSKLLFDLETFCVLSEIYIDFTRKKKLV